jgi:hypothetical protein
VPLRLDFMFGVFGARSKIAVYTEERNNLALPEAYGCPSEESCKAISHSQNHQINTNTVS